MELVYEGEQEGAQGVARALVGRAIATTLRRYVPDPARKGRRNEPEREDGRGAYRDVLGWFSKGNTVDLDPEMTAAAYVSALDRVDGLKAFVERYTTPESPAETASMMELVLELLHQNSMLGKEIEDGAAGYADMMGSVLSGLGSYDPDDDPDFDDDRYS